jgi:hypothetical protein
MRNVGGQILLLLFISPLISGCLITGRAVFNPGGSGDGASRVDNDPPAAVPLTFEANSIEKVSTTDAILKTSSVGSDANSWLLMIADVWKPTTFIMDGKIYFTMSTKSDDSFWGGWHRLFASWSPGDAAGKWSNGSSVSPGATPDWGKFDTANDSWSANNDQKTFNFVVGENSMVYGIGVMRSNQAGATQTQFPVVGVTPSALFHLTAVDTSHPNPFTSTWNHELYYEDGTIYDFWSDTGTVSTLTLTQTQDMLTTSASDQVLSTHLGRAFVSKAGTNYILVAFNTASDHWEMYRSASLTSWDFSQPVDLRIRDFVGTSGAWDSSTFSYVGSSGEPMLVGARVLGDYIYFFYMAGDFDYPGAAPYGSPRGIGVLRAPLIEASDS